MVLGSEIRDPGSGKNPFRIPDPGVKKAPDPGSRIRNTAGILQGLYVSSNILVEKGMWIRYGTFKSLLNTSSIKNLDTETPEINADPEHILHT
jgi:hypothetical protein